MRTDDAAAYIDRHLLSVAGGATYRGARMLRAAACVLVVAATGTVEGAQVESRFNVEVTLDQGAQVPSLSNSGLCRISNIPGAFGAVVTVVCATGVVVEIWSPSARSPWLPTNGASYRFLPPVSLAGVMSGNLDMNTGLGTVTSWRVIKLADRDILEMTVRW
jgi:hypothetical protein